MNQQETPNRAAHEPVDEARTESQESAANRRIDPRYMIGRSLVAIPIAGAGQLDWPSRVYGMSLDISRRGLGFSLSTDVAKPAGEWVVGLETAGDELRYIGAKTRFARSVSASEMHVGVEFTGTAQNLIASGELTPVFDPEQLIYRQPLPADVLETWTAAGVLRPVVCDRVDVCPRCHALPTFRQGCRQCSSARVECDRLIHHFACAHVGPAEDFDADGGSLVCPKCRTKGLIVGADFEFLNGPYVCTDCGWNDTELNTIAHCLRCDLRFTAPQAHTQDLIAYHVEQLDPLALITAS